MEYIIGYSGAILLIMFILVVNRHIIGLPWYRFFYPLIIWWCISSPFIASGWILLSITTTLIWRIIAQRIAQYIYISLYPKYALYMMISMSLFILSWYFYTQQIDSTILSKEDAELIMLFFIILASSIPKIYNEGKWIRSLSRWTNILWLLFLSYIAKSIISSAVLVSYLSQHIIIIVLVAIVIVIVWLYTGLQVKEIIRFRKLIWTKITNKKRRVE